MSHTASPTPPFPTRRGAIVGGDRQIRAILQTVERVARSNCSVLVTGESGTGKDLIVAALHDASDRHDAALVGVNCRAIPEVELAVELFGAGAVSPTNGTQSAQPGRIAEAEGGTLCLDDVTALPVTLQARILRLLQTREYTRVGDPRVLKADVRVVFATSRDLEAEVAAGRFREDLYFRLNVVHLHLPPLRERGDDVFEIAVHYLHLFAAKAGRTDLHGFDDRAIDLLRSADWAGNIRALEHTIERATLLTAGPLITAANLEDRVRPGGLLPSLTAPIVLPGDGMNLKSAVAEFESELIRQALARTGGNKNRAAQLLGLNRTTLVEMVKRKKLA